MTWNWIRESFRLVGGLSIFSLLTLKRRDLFKRILSDTNRHFCEAWGMCVASTAPQQLTGVQQPVTLVLDHARTSLGLEELVPILELVQLSGAKRILEIGTSSGGTTWHFAANMGPDAKVVTVDLPPKLSDPAYSPRSLATERPAEEALGRHFRGTPESERIEQILMDSRDLSTKPFGEKFDLIFIDGAHSYEFVKTDTENALGLVRDGGYIVWHDYFVFHPDYGVRRYLNEFSRSRPIWRLRDSLCAVAAITS